MDKLKDVSAEIPMINSSIDAVQKANTDFYEAFEALDIQKMDAIWLKENHAKCVHPGWEICKGWPDVRDSWVLIFNHTLAIKFSIVLLDVVVKDHIAWTICEEMISTKDNGKWLEGRVLSTNLFEYREGQWLLIHHHGSPVLATGKEDEEATD